MKREPSTLSPCRQHLKEASGDPVSYRSLAEKFAQRIREKHSGLGIVKVVEEEEEEKLEGKLELCLAFNTGSCTIRDSLFHPLHVCDICFLAFRMVHGHRAINCTFMKGLEEEFQ